MPFRGQRTHPTSGVKGGKPKILPSFKRKRLPKLPATPEAKDLQEQSSIYLKERNLAMRLKRMREEMLLAKERGQLIERELAITQLSYLMANSLTMSWPRSMERGQLIVRELAIK